MTQMLVHRGPDDEGHWHNQWAAFGHRRLSIIDLENGDQPMISARGSVLIYNGEIYNFREQRKKLEATGYQFRTRSDSEVVLALYETYGRECVQYLRGMFAFAIWDNERQELFIARDHLGKKPLYYTLLDGVFAFGSELKAVMAWPRSSSVAEIDLRSLSDYLSFGYILSPKTIYRGVSKLPAGTYAIYDPKAGDLNVTEYWNLAQYFNAPSRPYDATAKQELNKLLGEAVEERLYSDVAVGSFLSGGIDSATIVAKSKNHDGPTNQCFVMGFEDERFDETAYARTVATQLNVPLKTLTCRPPSQRLLREISDQLDEPFADTSIVPTWQLCEAVSKDVKVAVSGDGGDEVFAGYPTIKADRYYNYYRFVPGPAQRFLMALFNRWLTPSYGKVSRDYRIKKFLGAAGLSREQAHLWWRTIFSEDEKRRMLSPEIQEALGDYNPIEEAAKHFAQVANASFLNQTLYVDMKTWLVDDILVKVDRMSMAHSLEVRSPLLDHRIVEFMAGIEDSGKLIWRKQKVALKDIVKDILPGQIVNRRKAGFGAPYVGDVVGTVSTAGLGDMFVKDFELSPSQEDVTYKSFVLTILASWLSGNYVSSTSSPKEFPGNA